MKKRFCDICDRQIKWGDNRVSLPFSELKETLHFDDDLFSKEHGGEFFLEINLRYNEGVSSVLDVCLECKMKLLEKYK